MTSQWLHLAVIGARRVSSSLGELIRSVKLDSRSNNRVALLNRPTPLQGHSATERLVERMFSRMEWSECELIIFSQNSNFG